MALKVTYIKEEAPSPKVVVDARLFETADHQRLVPEGHPEAAFLFCTPGREVSKEAFERFELDRSLGKVKAEETDRGEPDGSADGEIPDAEASAEPETAEEKALEGPPEDKAVRKRRTKKRTQAV